MGFGRIIDRHGVSELVCLGVDYYHRKSGIGKALFKFLIEESRRVYPGNPMYGVIHRPGFLASFGFKEVKEVLGVLEHKKYHECLSDPLKD